MKTVPNSRSEKLESIFYCNKWYSCTRIEGIHQFNLEMPLNIRSVQWTLFYWFFSQFTAKLSRRQRYFLQPPPQFNQEQLPLLSMSSIEVVYLLQLIGEQWQILMTPYSYPISKWTLDVVHSVEEIYNDNYLQLNIILSRFTALKLLCFICS